MFMLMLIENYMCIKLLPKTSKNPILFNIDINIELCIAFYYNVTQCQK